MTREMEILLSIMEQSATTRHVAQEARLEILQAEQEFEDEIGIASDAADEAFHS